MRKITIFAIIPLLAAVSCVSPTAMQSTEYDDMYYSSSDKTAYAQPERQTYEEVYAAENTNQSSEVAPADGEVLNPEYSGSNVITNNYSGDEYYDGRTYNPRDNWYQPNYSFIDPYWGSAYVPSYSRYSNRYYGSAFYDPFFDPFYDPFYSPYYGSAFYDPFMRSPYWGSGLSINIGINYGWGSRWGYSPFYNRWSPFNNYYNGFYNGYYGRHVYYDSPVVGRTSKVQYGPRQTRGVVRTDSPQRITGRPERSLNNTNTDNAVISRPGRTERTSRAVAPTENGKTVLPARPQRNQNIDYNRPTRQSRESSSDNLRQSREQRVVTPSRESRTRTREYTPSREYRQQQQSNSYERPTYNRSTYERSSTPSYSPSQSSGSSSGSSGSSSGGGRPSRR